MKVTIEVTLKEIRWLRMYVKGAIILQEAGISYLTPGDRILGRIYDAVLAEMEKTADDREEDRKKGS